MVLFSKKVKFRDDAEIVFKIGRMLGCEGALILRRYKSS